MKKQSFKERYNVPLFAAAIVLVVVFVILLLLFPTQMNNGISAAFDWCTTAAGAPVQLMNLALIGFSLYIAFSKYGNVKLGKGKPKYSTFAWLGMIFTAGLGAGTMYWGILCTAIPLVCLLINVDLNVFKSLGIVVAFPILICEVILLWFVTKQLREDYGMMTDVEIKKLFANPEEAEK